MILGTQRAVSSACTWSDLHRMGVIKRVFKITTYGCLPAFDLRTSGDLTLLDFLFAVLNKKLEKDLTSGLKDFCNQMLMLSFNCMPPSSTPFVKETDFALYLFLLPCSSSIGKLRQRIKEQLLYYLKIIYTLKLVILYPTKNKKQLTYCSSSLTLTFN